MATSPSIPANDSVIVPLGLRTALESGNCVLFVGAGLGEHVLDKEGKPAPDGRELARRMADNFKIDTGGDYDLAEVAEIVELRIGRPELETFIKSQVGDLRPDEAFQWLTRIRWKAIFTTNYDNVIETAYNLNPNPPLKPVPFGITPELFPIDTRFDVPVYHLHGRFSGIEKPFIVITQSDYVTFRDPRRMLFELLKKEFATSTILYVGYSNRDPNWKLVLEEMREEFYPSPLLPSYRVAPDTQALNAEILTRKGVETINARFADFVSAASVALDKSAYAIDLLGKAQYEIPASLAAEYENNPTAMLRLLASWKYVNSADFNEQPNTKIFFRGDRPNWSLAAKKIPFERDIQEEVYDTLLDFYTSTSSFSDSLIVIGPAGYGTTTLLTILATQLVSDRAGHIFYHKSGAPLIEGDLEFAASLFGGTKKFLFVDNAADHSSDLHNISDRLRRLKSPALLVMGERKNEWRQSRGRYFPKEYELESLSDAEIMRLLDTLKQNGELNKLATLSLDVQFGVVKSKHGKELLVTLREATEDNNFDAILIDEFKGIGNDLSRRLYLTVCGFYTHGAYVRDVLLASLLGCDVAKMYDATRSQTEGVVIYDLIDSTSGRYGARARHRAIAATVWERCGDTNEKENLLQQSIEALNLNYGADQSAFEQFVRSDRVVESLRTFDAKTRFFEAASKKDPQSPYVKQHYARMLLHEGRPELALGQIDSAIEVTKDLRVLYHTKGVILAQLARTTDSIEVARKRLFQAEKAFRQCLSMYSKDDWAYSGLAMLYLDWARREAEDSAEYLSKCEQTISEGLRASQNRESLLLVSAQVQEFLGNDPKRIQELERAVRADKQGNIARYVLGRAYLYKKEPQKAIDVIKPVVISDPDEYRACIVYALALLGTGETYSTAISGIRIGSLYGFRDPRYIAVLGGMLFMNTQFSEAQDTFAESGKRNFSNIESNNVYFRPRGPDKVKALRLRGRVAAVRPGYCFVENKDYPRFFCPASRFGKLILRVGQEVTFSPVFSARGAGADAIDVLPK
ncbi:MAG TPA: SIR2 family protein [Terriglobales bacterium]|jgi:tetratricopeptide (TPR) repeat protein|nr:SIR2 family protein [Terriglobales bacterium]